MQRRTTANRENMSAKWFLITLVAILLFAAATGRILDVKAATTRSFTLYGSFNGGWGFTSDGITSPGPTIVVEQGDTVNLTLISNDGVTHRFFVSYTNSSSWSSGDPESQGFSATLNYQFVATDTIGTYQYHCAFHPDMMWGYFRVAAAGTIPEFPSLIAPLLLAAGTIIAAVAYKRKRQV